MSLENKILGFIGGGNMANAIADGLLAKGVVNSSQIIVSSQTSKTLEKWEKKKVEITYENKKVIEKSDIVILACKPHQLDSVFNVSYNVKDPSKLFISILAGISSDIIYNKLVQSLCKEHANTFGKPRVIRVMPNTPLTVGEGCSGICVHSSATEEDFKVVKEIFSSLGKSEVVPESQMHAVTALVGSGPAYVYMMIEALSDGAVKKGLPRNLATLFAAQTVLGAAKMVLKTNKHPGQLKDEVCSAGGTTIHGLHALEKGGLRATIMSGIEAAAQRSLSLSGEGGGESCKY